MAKKVKMSRSDAKAFHPTKVRYAQEPMWSKGEHIGYNSGVNGWNWDLIKYRGKYYVSGYRNLPA